MPRCADAGSYRLDGLWILFWGNDLADVHNVKIGSALQLIS
ncbi:hypothetical protein DSUL_140092 [Desulfovibrionales bacterium]